MLTSTSKLFAALGLLGALGWFFYTSGTGGDLMGSTLLLALFLAGIALAVFTSGAYAGDVEQPTPADAPAPAMRPATAPGQGVGPSAFPVVIAAGLATAVLSAAFGMRVLYVAAVILTVGGLGWLSHSWREHPVWTARFGDRISARVASPATMPIVAVGFGAVVVASVSRIFLTVSEHGAVVLSGLIAGSLFAGCVIVAMGKSVGQRITGALAGVAAVSLVAAGLTGAANGTRTIERHPDDYALVKVKAEGIAYNTKTLVLPVRLEPDPENPNADQTVGKVRIEFDNADAAGTYHDIGIYDAKVGGKPFVEVLPIDGGKKRLTVVDVKAAGLEPGRTYTFRCDFHPAMVGELTVTERTIDEVAA